jgi:putative acetyltransferase
MVIIENYNVKIAAELWQVYFTSIRMVCIKDYSEEQVQAWASESFELDLFKEKMDQINPFVAILNDKIIGYADLQADGLIDHFFVHGNYQGKGAGTALMKNILKEGCNKPKLYSYVSHTAKSFFIKHGFLVEKVRQEEVRGCKIENNIMVRKNRC